MRHVMRVVVASVALLASSSVQAADWDDCWDLTGLPALSACSRLIASGRYSGDMLGKIYTARSFHHIGLNNMPAVIDDCNRALALNPRDETAYHNRAVAKGSSGDVQAALADADQAIRVKPDYYNAFVLRGRLYERLGNLEQARANFRVAAGAPPTAQNQRAITRGREGLARVGQ
jgi:tetratricopeptide (TPR) repeat protein